MTNPRPTIERLLALIVALIALAVEAVVVRRRSGPWRDERTS